jgi:hypothetical protein
MMFEKDVQRELKLVVGFKGNLFEQFVRTEEV